MIKYGETFTASTWHLIPAAVMSTETYKEHIQESQSVSVTNYT